MDDWKDDKKWSDRFLVEIKRILGEYLISEPSVEEDAEYNTDLIVLKLEAVRIACRIRRNKYLIKYGDEFTIRAGRPLGTKTELTKIIEGWGNYIFYGFSDENESKLDKWILGDLNAFRIYFNRKLYNNEKSWIAKDNTDGSSNFISFKYNDIPGFIIGKSEVHHEI